MVGMGYSQEEIQESLSKMKYDEVTATYLLLGRKSSEVRARGAQGLYVRNCARAFLNVCSRFNRFFKFACKAAY